MVLKRSSHEVVCNRRFLFDDVALSEAVAPEDLFIEEEALVDFNDIVDQDDERIQTFVSQELCGKLVQSTYFKCTIFFLIGFNAILIALETDEELAVANPHFFAIFGKSTLTIFTCELGLKWYYGFWIFWKDGWNIFDFFLIAALQLGPNVTFLGSSRILRILRVLRAFRSLRNVAGLAQLSMIMQSILQSIPDMANIGLLLFIIIIVLSVMGVTLFGEIVPKHFGALPEAMFSLFICVTQDGWMQIFRNFSELGGSYYIGGMFYFGVAILLGAFVFANLVVAVVVTNLEASMRELKQLTAADNLASTEADEENEETPNTVLGLEQIVEKAHPTRQHPSELLHLEALDENHLKTLYLILNALAENVDEYNGIRNDFDRVYDCVRDLNTKVNRDKLLNDANAEVDLPRRQLNRHLPHGTSLGATAYGLKGDILSNLMELQKEVQDSGTNLQHLITKAARHLAYKSLEKLYGRHWSAGESSEPH